MFLQPVNSLSDLLTRSPLLFWSIILAASQEQDRFAGIYRKVANEHEGLLSPVLQKPFGKSRPSMPCFFFASGQSRGLIILIIRLGIMQASPPMPRFNSSVIVPCIMAMSKMRGGDSPLRLRVKWISLIGLGLGSAVSESAPRELHGSFADVRGVRILTFS
jgi:hypothetical protein